MSYMSIFRNTDFSPLILFTFKLIIATIITTFQKRISPDTDDVDERSNFYEDDQSENSDVIENPQEQLVDQTQQEQLTNQNQQIINVYPELPEPNWINIGFVEKIYMYGITSGAGTSYQSCEFTKYGMKTENNGMSLWDGMFLVYDQECQEFRNYWYYGALILLKVEAVNESQIKFSALGMPELIIDMSEEVMNNRDLLYFPTWHNNSLMKCIDCGSEVANWLNEYLRTINLRLYLKDYNSIIGQENVNQSNWMRFQVAYTDVSEENLSFFPNLPRYVITTKKTIEELNRLTGDLHETLRYRPNILISNFSCLPFQEQEWEWIRIGNTVLRKIKPVPRYSVNNITVPFIISLDADTHLGVYYALYVSGNVRVGDNVFIHSSLP